jgi:hypothetical protein
VTTPSRPTAHDIITAVTEAPDNIDAYNILDTCPLAMVWEIADLLYIDTGQHGRAWTMAHIVVEARS